MWARPGPMVGPILGPVFRLILEPIFGPYLGPYLDPHFGPHLAPGVREPNAPSGMRGAPGDSRFKLKLSFHSSYTVAPEGVAGFKALCAFRRHHCMRACSVSIMVFIFPTLRSEASYEARRLGGQDAMRLRD